MARHSVTTPRRGRQAHRYAGQAVVSAAEQLREWMYLDLTRRAHLNRHAGDCARCGVAIAGSGTVSPCRDGAELGRLAAESARAVLELRQRIAAAAAAARDDEPGTDLATLF